MAGSTVRFFMLLRDAPAPCQALAPDLDMTQLVDRIKIVRLAFVIFQILCKQQEQLPKDYTHPSGTALRAP